MAVLHITEHTSHENGVPKGTSYKHQQIAIGGTSVQSAAFDQNTKLIRVASDATCAVEIALSPTAVAATSIRIAANVAGEYFIVRPGDKIAVITTS